MFVDLEMFQFTQTLCVYCNLRKQRGGCLFKLHFTCLQLVRLFLPANVHMDQGNFLLSHIVLEKFSQHECNNTQNKLAFLQNTYKHCKLGYLQGPSHKQIALPFGLTKKLIPVCSTANIPYIGIYRCHQQ